MATKRRRNSPPKNIEQLLFSLISEMEEPLHAADHLIKVISLIDVKEPDEYESISFVASEAKRNLSRAKSLLRALFDACRETKI